MNNRPVSVPSWFVCCGVLLFAACRVEATSDGEQAAPGGAGESGEHTGGQGGGSMMPDDDPEISEPEVGDANAGGDGAEAAAGTGGATATNGGAGGQGPADAGAGPAEVTDTFTLQGFLACIERESKLARPLTVKPGAVYQPVCDMINFEIEDAPAGNGWSVETMFPGFSGLSYYRFTGGSGVLRYRFLITRAGKYRVFFHNRHEHPDLTLENDCFTSIDGGPKVKTGGGGAKVWNWNLWFEFVHEMNESAVLDLKAGEHVLEISGRSTGYAVDRVTIRPDSTPVDIFPRREYPLSPTK